MVVETALKRCGDTRRVTLLKSAQYELADLHADDRTCECRSAGDRRHGCPRGDAVRCLPLHPALASIHTQPPVSAAVGVRSILAHSRRAAVSRCSIRTGWSRSAAIYAALSAMFRIFPRALRKETSAPRCSRAWSDREMGTQPGT